MSRAAAALTVACPSCGMDAGIRCRTQLGRVTQRPHGPRLAVAATPDGDWPARGDVRPELIEWARAQVCYDQSYRHRCARTVDHLGPHVALSGAGVVWKVWSRLP